MKQSSSPESQIPIENLIMYIPNVGGIHDSDVVSRQGLCESRVMGGDIGFLLRDCRNHEALAKGQMDLCIPSSGIRFHSDHDECQNTIVGFPLGYGSTQDSRSHLHGIGNVISDSKYLKATQKLLDDVVNVKKALKQHSKPDSMYNSKEACGEWKNERDSSRVSAPEKKDLQNKMTKLSSMLNEVDRRYKQYYNEMQIVVSSFDALAGYGAANTYTKLTLQTISSKFRPLRDAIKSQIQVISRRLGKTELNGDGIGIPRLRFVDQHVRQQTRVQPIGPHIWRPQRGLPESSVSVLRAWLFEHFLHPYPKDSEKIMLARKTGLTRSQPMVEEMYKEESIDAEMDSNSSSETPTKKTSIHQTEDKNQSRSASSSSYQALIP
ncbi:hypothetical protein L2E82_51596 [Cichorium intybus]|nr:hypothetical protein L2E82_51596 [Cichorium intybus]